VGLLSRVGRVMEQLSGQAFQILGKPDYRQRIPMTVPDARGYLQRRQGHQPGVIELFAEALP